MSVENAMLPQFGVDASSIQKMSNVLGQPYQRNRVFVFSEIRLILLLRGEKAEKMLCSFNSKSVPIIFEK